MAEQSEYKTFGILHGSAPAARFDAPEGWHVVVHTWRGRELVSARVYRSFTDGDDGRRRADALAERLARLQ